MHVIIVTYRHWSQLCFVVRGKSVLCHSVVSCRLGLSVVTAPQESLIYIYISYTWGAHTKITDGSISMWGVARSSSTPPVVTNAFCILSVTTWDYIFHGFSLFHIMLFIYSCYGGFILIWRCEVTSYISEMACLWYGLFREQVWQLRNQQQMSRAAWWEGEGGGVSQQLVCWRSDWYFLEWKNSPW